MNAWMDIIYSDSKGLRTSKASGVAPNPSKTWEPGALMGRRRWVSQLQENLPLFYLFIPFGPPMDWMMPTSIREYGSLYSVYWLKSESHPETPSQTTHGHIEHTERSWLLQVTEMLSSWLPQYNLIHTDQYTNSVISPSPLLHPYKNCKLSWHRIWENSFFSICLSLYVHCHK